MAAAHRFEGSGNVFVLWQEIIFSGGSHGGEMLFARSSNGGRTFSEPQNLSDSVAGDGKGRIDKDYWHNGSFDLVVGADGMIHTAWTEYEGALWYRRSADGGKTFSAKTRVPDAKPARAPSLAARRGTVYLAWTVGDDRAADIRVSRDFGAPVIVGKSEGYSDAPKLAVDARGTVHLVYSDERRILYSRSKDGARSFEQPRDISDRGAGFPALEVDANGNVYVIWERFTEHAFLARGLGDSGVQGRRCDFQGGGRAGRGGRRLERQPAGLADAQARARPRRHVRDRELELQGERAQPCVADARAATAAVARPASGTRAAAVAPQRDARCRRGCASTYRARRERYR